MILLIHEHSSFRSMLNHNLHFTMILLILMQEIAVIDYPQDLHFTMILLIPDETEEEEEAEIEFTFHYDSINSIFKFYTFPLQTVFTFHYDSINSFFFA